MHLIVAMFACPVLCPAIRRTWTSPFKSSVIWAHRRKLRQELDLPPLRFHELRHSCATLLLARNVYRKVVQERLGHASMYTMGA